MQTIKDILKQAHSGEKIAMLTAYDAAMATILERAGIDCILVGDSLGMVIQGQRDTLGVTVNDVAYHTKLVRQGAPNTFIIADMPFMSTASIERTLSAAQNLMHAGADMVKIEGGNPSCLSAIEALHYANVPVCGHLGLQPTQIRQHGAYIAIDASKRNELLTQSRSVLGAGATMLVLECVHPPLAQEIAHIWENQCVIGIGSGSNVHGQVLVSYDVLGISPNIPSFSRTFLTNENSSIESAFQAYILAVHSKKFPSKS